MGELVRNGVVVAILFAALLIVVPIYTSSATYSIVLTASMEPAINVGDVVAVQRVDPYDVEVGDVVAFQHPEGTTTTPIVHRVMEIRETEEGLELQTKGDNLEEEDPFVVGEEHVMGKVAYTIPKVGWLINSFRTGSRAIYVLMILGPAALLVYGEVRSLMRDEDEEETGSGATAADATYLQRVFASVYCEHSQVDEEGDETSLLAFLALRLAGPALPQNRDEPDPWDGFGDGEGPGGFLEVGPDGRVRGEPIVVQAEPGGDVGEAGDEGDGAPASAWDRLGAVLADAFGDGKGDGDGEDADTVARAAGRPRAARQEAAPPPLPEFLEPRWEPRWHVLAAVVGPVTAGWSLVTEFVPSLGAVAAARALFPAGLWLAMARVHLALPGLAMLALAAGVAAAASARWWLVRREPPEALRRLAERRLGKGREDRDPAEGGAG